MLSDNLSKIANLVLASKLTNFLKPSCDNFLIKNYFNKKDFSQLTDQEKKQLTTQTTKKVNEIQETLKEISTILGVKNFDKNFIMKMIQLVTQRSAEQFADVTKIPSYIFEQHVFVNTKHTIQDFVKYKQFIDPDKRDINQFNTLSQISQLVLKYKREQQQQLKNIRQFNKVTQYGNGYTVIQFNDEDQKNAIKWLKGKTKWCVIQWGYWKNYTRPYFLILKQLKPYMLVNIPTCQFKDINDAPIKKEAVDKEIIKITKDIFHTYYNDKYWDNKVAYGDDFSPIKPYYPSQAIVQGIKKNRINQKQLDEIIQRTIQTMDKTLIENLINVLKQTGKNTDSFIKNINTDAQYKLIAKILYNVDEQDEQNGLKNSVKLSRNDLIKMIFDSFKAGSKGLSLFKRLIKFHRSEQNFQLYIQGDETNEELINSTYQGKTLFDNIASKKQLEQLEKIFGKEITLDQKQALVVFKNSINQKSPNVDMVQYLLEHKYIELNSQMLLETLQSGKDIILTKFLQNADKQVFNTPLYDNMLPIFYCVKQQKIRLLNLLLQSKKVDINATTSDGRDIMWYALQLDNKQLVGGLIKYGKGINLNKIYAVGVCADNTLLTYFVNKNNNEIINLLLENNDVDINLNSPVDIAISKNNNSLVDKFLNSSKFDQFYPNENGDVPIMVAIKTDNTFGMFEKFANKIGKSKLVSAQLTNKKTKETLLQVAIDNNIPFEILTKYFDSKNVSYATNKIYNLVLSKLAIHPNDENMLKIKQWMFEQNKSKTKTKKSKLQQQLKTLAYKNNEQAFKQLLQKHAEQFDFSKKVDGVNLIYLFASSAPNSKYLKLLLQFISNSTKYSGQLKGLLQQQFNYENAYDNAASVNKNILKPYYQKSNIKVSNKQFKKILAFVEKYIN